MTEKAIAKKEIEKMKEKSPKGEKPKRLLLNKSSLEIVVFGSLGQNRYKSFNLNCLHVTKNYVEATNENILVRFSHPKIDPDEFPETQGEPFSGKVDFSLPIESVRGLKIPTKTMLPILSTACLSKEGEMISVSTTDLQTMQTLKIRPMEGEFADTEQLIDKSIDDEGNNEWKRFTINSDLLKILANYVSKRGGKDKIPITFWIKDSEGLIHFRFRFSDTEQDGRGVLMLMKDSDVRKGLGLV